ncbi:MAG: HAMP domain-containing histidine kinase [Lewinellaceae bacterium]|nr:HAMP domain-containing histidine kinase [Lewinellaceae bacterium]
MRFSQLFIVKSIGLVFIITYLLLIYKTYTYITDVQNFSPHQVTSAETLQSKGLTLFDSPMLDSVATGIIPWPPEDTVFLTKIMSELSARKSDKYVSLLLNGSLSFFFLFSGIAFLFIWLRTNAIIDRSPEITRPKLKLFFNLRGRKDFTMIFLSLAILIWLLSNLVTLHYHKVTHERLLVTSLLSSLNSAFFLAASIDFDYQEKPKWLRWWIIDRLFQQFDGILAVFFVVAVASVPLNILDKNLNAGYNGAYLADFFFSLIAIVIVGYGLWELFRTRLNKDMGIMVIASMSLVFIAQLAIIFPKLLSILSPESYLFIATLISVAYKTTLVTLFLILVITWATRQIEKNNNYHMAQLREKINELDIQNGELSKMNTERDKINQSLSMAKNEIAHRVKNSLSILHNFVESRIGMYAHDPEHTTYLELWKIRVRSEGILLVHEFLDKKHNGEVVDQEVYQEIIANKVHDKVMLRLFLQDLLSRLEKAFGYESGNFNYDFSGIDEFLAAKLGIAKDVAMVITELAINVNQHAYPNGEEKKINIKGSCNSDTLVIKVEDEGIGDAEMSMKFEKGHGRSIIKEIVDQHGGSIRGVTLGSQGFIAVLEFPLKNLN